AGLEEAEMPLTNMTGEVILVVVNSHRSLVNSLRAMPHKKHPVIILGVPKSIRWRLPPLRIGIGGAVVVVNGIGHSVRRGYSGCVGERTACRCADRPAGCVGDAAAGRHCDRITDVARARGREA